MKKIMGFRANFLLLFGALLIALLARIRKSLMDSGLVGMLKDLGKQGDYNHKHRLLFWQRISNQASDGKCR